MRETKCLPFVPHYEVLNACILLVDANVLSRLTMQIEIRVKGRLKQGLKLGIRLFFVVNFNRTVNIFEFVRVNRLFFQK
jgi:hypothetical protein